MPEPRGWRDVLAGIRAEHPFLGRFWVTSGHPDQACTPTGFNEVVFRIAGQVGAKSTGTGRLAVVVPRRHELALWTAVLCSLDRMRRDFEPALMRLPALEPGQKMLLDGRWVVEFNTTEQRNGRKWLQFWMGGDRASRGFPVEDRLRFQPANTARRLTPMSRRESYKAPPPSTLDNLLSISTRGNLTLFSTRIIVVTPIAKAKRLASAAKIRTSTESTEVTELGQLFQWGHISEDGEQTLWGQSVIPANPVLLVAPNLAVAMDFAKSDRGRDVSLMILDGSASFASEAHLIDEGVKCPTLGILDFGDLASVKNLTDRGFGVAVWIPQEVDDSLIRTGEGEPPLFNPFSELSRSLRNYGKFELLEHDCEDDGITASHDLIEKLGSLVRQSKSLFQEELGRFYECLLMASRLIHQPSRDPAQGAWIERYLKRIASLEEAIAKNKTWLTRESHGLAKEALANLRGMADSLAAGRNPKLEVLAGILDGIPPGQIVCLVVSSTDDVQPTLDYWRRRLGSKVNLHANTPSDLDPDLDYDAIIPCGWLNWERMSSLWDAHLAPMQHLLVYPFESVWARSGRLRWQRERQPKTNRISKVSLLGSVAEGAEETAKYSVRTKATPPPAETGFDIAEFEFRLRAFRRHVLVREAASRENCLDATYVEFADGHYAFLAEGFRLRVVTDHIAGKVGQDSEIPTKSAAEIRTGDFVVFREGGSGDVIRVMADRALAKAGLQDLRQIARLWKVALARKAKLISQGMRALVVLLQVHGCTRTESTIRRWIRDDPEDYQIGPGAEDDLKHIAEATKDPELIGRLEEVWRAIARVRSSHLQASGHLAELMLKQIPKHLGRVAGGAFPIEVEGIGRAWVLHVEMVAKETESVVISKINRLLRGE